MKEGKVLPPGTWRLIAGGALHAMLKVSGGQRRDGAVCSTFEITVPPGYDVGAHVHTWGEELFYVLEGTLDLLAFEPVGGHEDYLEELAALLRDSNGKPDPKAVTELRSRHDIHQLTRLKT